MKKSEILEHLNETDFENVKSYYKLNSSVSTERKIDMLIVYIKILTWEHIKEWGKDIIDITASEKNDDLIRVSIENVEFD